MIGLELADALARAHHLRILHRDIKPANILLGEDGSPRLVDFGLARLSADSSLTQAGTILGTPYYLSPEACYQQDLDERSDIWAFGVVLFEMLTGQRPFRGETPFDVIYAIKNHPLPDPCRYRPDLPPALAELVRQMLRKDRPARTSSARRVGAELEMIQKNLGKLPAGPPAEEAAAQEGPGLETAPAVGGSVPAGAPALAQTLPPTGAAPGAPAKIRVLIVDDHAVVRQGLRTLIDLQEDMAVVGEGGDGWEAIELAGQLQPDVILLDLVMPRMDGVSAMRQIRERSPGSHVFILTSFGDDSQVFPAIRSGAQGYLLKDIPPDELVQAVRAASRGQVQLAPEIARKLMSAVAASPEGAPTHADAAAQSLSGREVEVLRAIAGGLSNREIAEKLDISEKTVRGHINSLLGKLGLQERTQAALWAVKHGYQ
jgi:DNA-binding NarL/FixJ family response regulator